MKYLSDIKLVIETDIHKLSADSLTLYIGNTIIIKILDKIPKLDISNILLYNFPRFTEK